MAGASERLHTLPIVEIIQDGEPVLASRQVLNGVDFSMLAKRVEEALLFIFDPRDDATREAGVMALMALLEQIPQDKRVMFVTPGSSKSLGLTGEVVEAYRSRTGKDHQLFIFEKVVDDPRRVRPGYRGKVEAYTPVTSPDKPRYLLISPEQEIDIRQKVDAGALVVVLDDIVSTYATLVAIKDLLAQIGVSVDRFVAVGREVAGKAVAVHNGAIDWVQDPQAPEPPLKCEAAFTLPLFVGEDAKRLI